MKKLVILVMACLMSLSTMAFIGCGGGVDVDNTKTQIYVSSFDGGLGSEWIEKVGNVFADKVKNYSFEENRKGVQIIIKDTTDTGDYLQARMLSQDQDIYFTEQVVYNNYVNAGIVYDMTDIMNQGAIIGVDANGNFIRESSPVKDKVDGAFLDFLYTTKGSSTQKGYYAIPFYYAARGLIYDADLWNDNYFYLGKGGCPSEIVIDELAKGASANIETAIAEYKTAISGNLSDSYVFVNKEGYSKVLGVNVGGLSAGPDGKYGTADDGMPATIEEFYALMTKMTTTNVTPMIWPGASPNYAENLTNAFWQNDAGVEELELFYTLTGTTNSLVKINNNSIVKENGLPILESGTFTGGVDNGYDLARSVYKLNALNFIKKICSTSEWTHSSCYDGTTNVQAQTNFLTTGITKGGSRIAMLLDGCWWQTEATRTFDAVVKNKGEQYSKENRDFGFLYLPNSSIERLVKRVNNNEGYTIVPSTSSYIFINQRLANSGMTARLEAAKAFVSFLQSDEALYQFAQNTSMSRAIFTDFSEEQINALPKYCRNVIEYIGNANIVYPYTSNGFVNQNSTQFKNAADGWLWRTNIAGSVGEKYFPIQTMHDYNVSPEDYFCGMYNFYKNSMWPFLKK